MWGEVLGCGREDPELLARARETRARAMMVRAGEEGELFILAPSVLADELERADAELVPVVLLLRQAFESTSNPSLRDQLRPLSRLKRPLSFQLTQPNRTTARASEPSPSSDASTTTSPPPSSLLLPRSPRGSSCAMASRTSTRRARGRIGVAEGRAGSGRRCGKSRGSWLGLRRPF